MSAYQRGALGGAHIAKGVPTYRDAISIAQLEPGTLHNGWSTRSNPTTGICSRGDVRIESWGTRSQATLGTLAKASLVPADAMP